MEDNPSVIECQHIARLASVRWCQCICTHSAAWRVLLCPVRSMLAGGEGWGHSRGRMLTQPGLTTPGHGDIFCHREFSFKSKHGSPHHASHIWIICVTAECLWILSCALTTMAPHSGDGSEWSVECGVSPPEAAEARGGRASPGPCDQSLLSPPSLLTITISHHRTPGGHGQDIRSASAR